VPFKDKSLSLLEKNALKALNTISTAIPIAAYKNMDAIIL